MFAVDEPSVLLELDVVINVGGVGDDADLKSPLTADVLREEFELEDVAAGPLAEFVLKRRIIIATLEIVVVATFYVGFHFSITQN